MAERREGYEYSKLFKINETHAIPFPSRLLGHTVTDSASVVGETTRTRRMIGTLSGAVCELTFICSLSIGYHDDSASTVPNHLNDNWIESLYN